MRTKLSMILLTLLIFSGCQNLQELSKPKPVEIDGLGSLQSLKDKPLSVEELTQVIKTASARTVVDEADAQVMAEIYRKYGNIFLNSSITVKDNSKIISSDEVEQYLLLIVNHSSLIESVNLVTQSTITEEVQKTAEFRNDLKSYLGENAGNLAGVFVNACNKTFVQTQDEKRKVYEKQQAENKFNIINGYEQAANERMSGAREATIEEKKNAGQFIADLKSYNDSLPAERKILDANGRLISPSKMTGYQKAALQDIFSGSENQARRNLYERMRNAENELRISTEVQIKN